MLPTERRQRPAIPFVGLAEGYTLAAIRKAAVPLQRIRPALDRLSEEIGLGHALAWKRLYTDGAEVLYDYAGAADGDEAEALEELTVVRHGQRLFAEVVRDVLALFHAGESAATVADELGLTQAGVEDALRVDKKS